MWEISSTSTSGKNVHPDISEIIIELSSKLVDCLEKCLIYGHIRRFAD